MIGAHANEVVFVSGGTDANNLAIRGFCETHTSGKGHIITSTIEHPSVRGCYDALEQQGWEVTRLGVDEAGILLRAQKTCQPPALQANTVLISVMLANNEIGTIQPVAEIGELVREVRADNPHLRFHTDAVQAAGRLSLDVAAAGLRLAFFVRT